jgi:hypothetical protein
MSAARAGRRAGEFSDARRQMELHRIAAKMPVAGDGGRLIRLSINYSRLHPHCRCLTLCITGSLSRNRRPINCLLRTHKPEPPCAAALGLS